MEFKIFDETKISYHFTLGELINSPTAKAKKIVNIPNSEQLFCMIGLTLNILEPIRATFGPIKINSMYRCPALNEAVGGASLSDHQILAPYTDCAVDITNEHLLAKGITMKQMFKWIIENLNYYKLIWEFGTNQEPRWIHISYSTDPIKNKQKNTYRAINRNGKTTYVPFDLKLLK